MSAGSWLSRDAMETASERQMKGCYDGKGVETSQVEGVKSKLTLAKIGLDDSRDWGISSGVGGQPVWEWPTPASVEQRGREVCMQPARTQGREEWRSEA